MIGAIGDCDPAIRRDGALRRRDRLASADPWVRSRQLYRLAGPVGSGQIDSARCMNHLVTPTTGVIEVAGIGPLNSSSRIRAHRRRTGMIFQQHQLIGRQTALRNALLGSVASTIVLHAFWRTNRHETYRALEALDRVGLLAKAMIRADRLSAPPTSVPLSVKCAARLKWLQREAFSTCATAGRPR